MAATAAGRVPLSIEEEPTVRAGDPDTTAKADMDCTGGVLTVSDICLAGYDGFDCVVLDIEGDGAIGTVPETSTRTTRGRPPRVVRRRGVDIDVFSDLPHKGLTGYVEKTGTVPAQLNKRGRKAVRP